MELVDARRLTGPNLQTKQPGAVAEVAFHEGDDPQRCYERWQHHLKAICSHLPFEGAPTVARFYDRGAAWVLPGPVDRLYAAILACEYAVAMTVAETKGTDGPDLQETLAAIQTEFDAEACGRLLEIQAEARRQQVPFLWDDDFVSVGYGQKSVTWVERDLPDLNEIKWHELSDMPVALVTGTNGKTTTSRLLARMVKCAGFVPGNSSTDGVFINEEMVEEGDWTGPGAARTILRRQDVEVAVLEAARGGILRRGLGVESCQTALVTNVANDHLGDYGILTVPQMAAAKGVVYDVVSPNGCCVFNADDENCRALSNVKKGNKLFFSVHGLTPYLQAQHDLGSALLYVDEGSIYWKVGEQTSTIADVTDCPLSMQGAALYNVSNMLGAIGLALSLELPHSAILEGLQSFGTSWKDNPGRGQSTSLDGVQILLDFGHNPHGVSAVLQMAQNFLKQQNRGGRYSVSMGQAGDRTDEDLRELCESVVPLQPAQVYLRNMSAYLRGRPLGEVPNILEANLKKMGYPADQINKCHTELESLQAALDWAKPGDLIVHLVHTERDEIHRFLQEAGAALD